MKNAILISFVILCSGCAVVGDMQKGIKGEQDYGQRARTEELMQAKYEAQQKARAEAVKPGVSIAEFESVWGKPEHTNYDNGTYVYWYSNDDKPTYFHFKNSKLIKWNVDQEAIRAKEKAQRDQEIARQNKKASCYTTNVFGTLVTECE